MSEEGPVPGCTRLEIGVGSITGRQAPAGSHLLQAGPQCSLTGERWGEGP